MIVTGLFFWISPIESIPPTNSFSHIIIDETRYDATSYDSHITLDPDEFEGTQKSNGVELNFSPLPYAQISSGETQLCPEDLVANVTFSNNDSLDGITHSTVESTHEIIIQTDGVYQFIASPQIGKSGQTTGTQNFWVTLNGDTVNNTNIKTTVQTVDSPDETLVSVLNWIETLQSGDIIVFQQSCDSANIVLKFTGTTAREPATPSIIVSVFKVG